MAEFLRWVRHPDGEIPLLNDAALNDEVLPDAIFRLLEKSGYRVDAVAAPRLAKFCTDRTGGLAWHSLDSLFRRRPDRTRIISPATAMPTI